MVEVYRNGPQHMRLLQGAVEGTLGWTREYSRQDYDKWLGEFDVRTPWRIHEHAHLQDYPTSPSATSRVPSLIVKGHV